MSALLTTAAEGTTGSAVELTAPTTVHCTGSFGLAKAHLECSLTADGPWIVIHTFDEPDIRVVDHTGTYFLRGRTTSTTEPVASISMSAE
jgi:hypothetical protein